MTENRIRPTDGFVRSYACQLVNAITPEVAALIAPVQPNAASICRRFVYGIDNGLTLAVTYDQTRTAHTESHRTLAFADDANGIPVSPFFPQVLIDAMLLILGGILLAHSGRTPGKWLLGLRVLHLTGLYPAIGRGAARLGPYLLITSLGPMTGMLSAPAIKALAALFLLQLTFAVGTIMALMLAWYVVPMLRWRGKMPWDRLSATEVIRA